MLVLFRPWNDFDGKHPGSLTWDSFCQYISQLTKVNDSKLSPFIFRVRLEWIKSISSDLKVDFKETTAAQKYRSHSATIWGTSDNTSFSPNVGDFQEIYQMDAADESRLAAAVTEIDE